MENLTDEEIGKAAREKVGKIVSYCCRKATDADIAAVRKMVQSAIEECGLDATAKVAVDTEKHCVTLGHNPIKAVIRIHGAYPAVRMANGTLVKGADTITVLFRREGGIYNLDKFPDMWEVLSGNRRTMSREDALKAGDSIPWEGESVKFNATTNGLAREYRKHYWYRYEGGKTGYAAINENGGHFGYSDSWEHLKVDFAAYVRKTATDLGYAGKVLGREVA